MIVFNVDQCERKLNDARFPGIRCIGSQIEAPMNAAALVQGFLDEQNAQYTWSDRSTLYSKPHALPAELREWVPAFLARHQRRIVEWAWPRTGAFFQAVPGSGKTLAAIVCALQRAGRILWVTRAISKYAHAREINKYTSCEAHVVEGETLYDLPDTRFTIINYEILHAWERVLNNTRFYTVVFDEIHKAKAAKRASAVPLPDGGTQFVQLNNISAVCARISRSVKRRIGMTATPVANRISDLWSQLDILYPREWGSRADWMTRYAGRHETEFSRSVDDGATNIEELKQRLSFDMLKITKAESAFALPPQRRQIVSIHKDQQMTGRERKKAKEIAGIGALESQLAMSSVRKRPLVREYVDEALACNQHVCVFVARKAEAAELHRLIAKAHPSKLVEYVTGSVSAKERDDAKERYRLAPSACFIATGDSMGEAIDGLQNTDLAIISYLPWTLSKLEQYEGRFFGRPGRIVPGVILYVVCQGTIDDHIAAVLLDKLPPVVEVTGSETVSDLRGTLLGGKTDSEIETSLVNAIVSGGIQI